MPDPMCWRPAGIFRSRGEPWESRDRSTQEDAQKTQDVMLSRRGGDHA